MKSHDLDIEDVEALVGPAETWHGRCHEIALAAASLIDDGEAVYGHYRGPVDPHGYWSDRAGDPFIQHGWVELADGRILDPTRWSFTDDEPEIAIVDKWDAEEEYDKGGQRLRQSLVKPPPPWNPSARSVSLAVPKGSDLEMALNTLIGEDQHGTDEHGGYVVNIMQAGWLANLPYATLAPHQRDIYRLLDKVGLLSFVPLDNQQMAGMERR